MSVQTRVAELLIAEFVILLGRFQNFRKVNSVNLSQISLLNVWLLVQIATTDKIF